MTFTGHFAFFVTIAFIGAIIAGFGKADRGSAARGPITVISIGGTKPLSVERNAIGPITTEAPAATTGCRP
jgi:hypothetical protein